MPRDLPIANGNLYIAYDSNGLLRELYFPHVGEETHTKGEPFRFGISINGSFSWIPQGWKVERDYLDQTLVTNLVFENEALKIVVNALVDFEENLYLKKITLSNKTDQPQEIRLFLAHDFNIFGTEVGDTAAYKPENNTLIHYKADRYFLINILANNKYGIDLFATGNKAGSDVGTWRDAEDGKLSANPIAQGAVDSVVGIPLTLAPRANESCFYWIAAGKNWDQVKELNILVKKRTPSEIFKRTHDYWKSWVTKENLNLELIPEKIGWLYKRSLLICRTQINNSGSVIAANDSDVVYFNRDTYSYMWPRDGALACYGFDLAGYNFTRNFFRFCSEVVTTDGYFLHKYTPSGTLGSSWHPWLKNQKPQLPIQEDETALVIWALWNHYQTFKDLEFIRSLYNPFIRKCADFMMSYRDAKTGLPLPSYDLWEERQGILTFTTATVFGGLTAAANFAELFGNKELSDEYRNGALKMREGMEQFLYLKDKKRFARMIYANEKGESVLDETIDASLYAIFAFGAYSPEDEKVASTMQQISEKLQVAGGIARYENDRFYAQNGQPSNPWFVTTLWLAQYKIARAKNRKELGEALPLLEWVANHALPSGVLAEQINPVTGEPLSACPLTWSHGTYIATVQEYLNKLCKLEKCQKNV